MPAAVLVLLIAGAAAILPISGRTPDEWLPVVADTFTARLRGEHRLSGAANKPGLHERSRRRGPQATAGDAAGAARLPPGQRHLADGSELGMLQDPELRTYTAVVVFHARAVSLLPPAEHERRLEQWGHVLAAL